MVKTMRTDNPSALTAGDIRVIFIIVLIIVVVRIARVVDGIMGIVLGRVTAHSDVDVDIGSGLTEAGLDKESCDQDDTAGSHTLEHCKHSTKSTPDLRGCATIALPSLTWRKCIVHLPFMSQGARDDAGLRIDRITVEVQKNGVDRGHDRRSSLTTAFPNVSCGGGHDGGHGPRPRGRRFRSPMPHRYWPKCR